MSIIVRSPDTAHWYQLDGSPQYTVIGKDGKDRATTLRDARTMNLLPSVTTIINIASKPGLEQWKLEQMLLAALTLPKRPDESEKAYIARIVADSKETAKQAAERGTRIHESIELWLGGTREVEHVEAALAVEEILSVHFKIPLSEANWVTEKSFADPRGFGGRVDLHTPRGIVVDVKTKDFGPNDKVDAYAENLMQLAAYREGLMLPNARCANVFVSRTNPGLVRIHEWEAADLERGWEMFESLHRFWKLKNNFNM